MQPIVTLKKKKTNPPDGCLCLFYSRKTYFAFPDHSFQSPVEPLNLCLPSDSPMSDLIMNNQCRGFGMGLYTRAGREQSSVCPHFEALGQYFWAADEAIVHTF